jgi:hypothetical protein
MDIFPKDEFKTLVAVQTAGCVSISIYMPTYRAGRAEVQQNQIRLKKMLREAQERLEKSGLRRPEAEDYLRPIAGLVDDSSFWVEAGDGLAVFLAKDYFRYFRLPVAFPELLETAESFHIRPLLPMLAADGRFYVLALSQNAVRLLQCTRFGFHELDIAGKIPRSLAEALRYDDTDREFQYHAHFGVRGLDSPTVSAHGPDVEDTKDNLLRFFQMLDRGLKRGFLNDETAPLVVIGVDYLFPIYKQANTYAGLLDKPFDGNPDKMSAADLHRHGLGAVEPYFGEKQAEARRLYSELTGLGRTTDKLSKIVSDSYHGRVQTLFVANDRQKWGSYDPATDKVTVRTRAKSCDQDLLDFAAAHTLAHRGEVYAVDIEQVPGKKPIAAALRY